MKLLKINLVIVCIFCTFTINAQIFEEGFENGGSLPNGWISTWEGGSVAEFNWRCNDGGFEEPEHAYEGDYNAYLRNDDGTFQAGEVRLELPTQDLSSYASSNVAFSFWQTNIAGGGGFMWNEFKVFYKTANGDTWTELAYIEDYSSAWTYRQYILPKPYTNDYHISFLGYETQSEGICIDNVSIFEFYYPPLNLSSISDDAEVELTWEAPEDPTDLSEYKIYRNRQELTTVSNSTLNYTDNTVANHTAYEYNVVAVYPLGESDPSNDVFEAPLGMLLPYFEDYENNGEKPFGWEEIFEFKQHNWIFQAGGRDGQPNAAYEGDYNACFTKNSDWTGKQTKLVTPKLNLSSYSDAELSFYYASVEDYAGHPNILAISYKNSSTAEWDTIFYTPNIEYPDWTEVTLTLPNLSDTYWIAVESYAYLGYGSCVDNFSITSSDLNTYDITFNVQDQNTNPIDGAEISLTGYGTQTTSAGSATFTNVNETADPGIAYTVTKDGYNVYSDNIIVDENETENVILISQPQAVSAETNTQGTEIELTFDKEMADPSTEPLESFYYDFTTKDGFPFTNFELKAGEPNTYILTCSQQIDPTNGIGLWYEQGAILSTDGGILQNFEIFVTNNVATNIENISNQINIYPNPSTGIFTLDLLTSPKGLSNVKITDITGKIIKQFVIPNSKFVIDISNQPTGIYFITIKTETGIYTEKIIIQ